MVYAIQSIAGGPVKVGSAAEPMHRLKQLQIGHPERLVLRNFYAGGRRREHAVHRDLAPWRLMGEWYGPEQLALAAIRVSIGTVNYESHGDRAFAVLTRPTPNSPTEWCPFCGERHMHGIPDGHRGAHCIDPTIPHVLALDETELSYDDGYIVRTVP